jgi:ribosome modulation factor
MPGPFVEAWNRGREAALHGEAFSANPYPPGTEVAGHWADGWRDGARTQAETTASSMA